MYLLRVRVHFDAAHYLEGYQGDCAKLHGHTWQVEVAYRYPDGALGNNQHGHGGQPVEGIITDFKVLKASLKALLPDHCCLNDIFDFNPTAENIAKWLSGVIKADHESVTVWESPDCGVTYVPDPTAFDLSQKEMVILNEREANDNESEGNL